MCKECADRSGDPRKAAFQPVFTMTWITQAQARQAKEYMETQANALMFLGQDFAFSEQDVRAKIAGLENDATISHYTLDKTAVCLN